MLELKNCFYFFDFSPKNEFAEIVSFSQKRSDNSILPFHKVMAQCVDRVERERYLYGAVYAKAISNAQIVK